MHHLHFLCLLNAVQGYSGDKYSYLNNGLLIRCCELSAHMLRCPHSFLDDTFQEEFFQKSLIIESRKRIKRGK